MRYAVYYKKYHRLSPPMATREMAERHMSKLKHCFQNIEVKEVEG